MIPRSWAPEHKTTTALPPCWSACQQKGFDRDSEWPDQTSSLSPATCWVYRRGTRQSEGNPTSWHRRKPPTTNVNCQTPDAAIWPNHNLQLSRLSSRSPGPLVAVSRRHHQTDALRRRRRRRKRRETVCPERAAWGQGDTPRPHRGCREHYQQ